MLLFTDDNSSTGRKYRKYAKKMLDEVSKFSTDIKMKLGMDKCKMLIINEDGGEKGNKKVKLLGQELGIIEEFKYLGIIIGKYVIFKLK